MNKQKETTSEKVGNLLSGAGVLTGVIGIILTFLQNYSWGIPMIILGGSLFFLTIYAENVGWATVFAKPLELLYWFPFATPLITFIICLTVLLTLAFTKNMYSPFMWFFALVGGVSLVHTTVALLKKSQQVREEQYQEEEDDRSEYERFVDTKLPEILIDYYSPVSEFPLDRPLRSEYASVQEFKAAVADAEEQRYEARLENADTYIGVAMEETDGVVEVLLTTKERTADEDLIKKLAMINSGLGAFGARVDSNPDRPEGQVVIFIDMERQPTTLEKLTPKLDGRSFFRENPPENQDAIPFGVTASGETFNLPLHHILCTGRTGSGKGSAFQTIIYQLMPFVAKGTARLWVADPKPAEVLNYVGKSGLHRYAIEDEEIVALIDEFEAEMNAQKKRSDLGRSNIPTVEYPANYLLLDEAASVFDEPAIANSKDDEGKTIKQKLKAITRKGRSLNFFVLMFTQEITADPMGTMPKNMPVKMVGYVESGYETAKALGVKEKQLESYPELIFPLPESTKANGMKYSGIFNVVMDGERLAVRVPFVSEEMIAERLAEFGFDKAPTDHSRTYDITVHKVVASSRIEAQELMAALKNQPKPFTPVSVAELDEAFSTFDED